MPLVKSLRENAGFAFVGEPPWPAAVINDFQAETFRLATNPSGRPNTDVVRGFIGITSGQTRTRWQVDFPAQFTDHEAGLYQDPANLLHQRTRASGQAAWWINPHASPALRVAIARVHRYLVTLRPGSPQTPLPAWAWAEADLLPAESLFAVARDDDFTHGILQSREFAVWWQKFYTPELPTLAFDSFPFPWPLSTPLGSLTGLQQELRYNISHAARQENGDALLRAVSTAYGWPLALEAGEIITRLSELNQRRPAA